MKRENLPGQLERDNSSGTIRAGQQGSSETTRKTEFMIKDIGNIASLMKNAQQMGGKIQQINDQLKSARVTGAAGGGMVTIEANGLGEVVRVKIDPTLLADGDVEMLEELLPGAMNQVRVKAQQMHQEAMQSLAGGLDLPGLNEAIDQLSSGSK